MGAGNVSRKEGNNRLAIDANGAYGRSNILTPDFNPAAPTVITGFHRNDVETTNNWLIKGRYDRFFTANNSGYAAASAAADKIAGKSFYGGGQVGYSRQIYKSSMHLLVAELGYDYSYERYVETRHHHAAVGLDSLGASVRRGGADADEGDRNHRQLRGAVQSQQGGGGAQRLRRARRASTPSTTRASTPR